MNNLKIFTLNYSQSIKFSNFHFPAYSPFFNFISKVNLQLPTFYWIMATTRINRTYTCRSLWYVALEAGHGPNEKQHALYTYSESVRQYKLRICFTDVQLRRAKRTGDTLLQVVNKHSKYFDCKFWGNFFCRKWCCAILLSGMWDMTKKIDSKYFDYLVTGFPV